MGCDRLSQPEMSEDIQKYQTLVALMLSVQTTDQITSMVIKRLQTHGLTPENIIKTPEAKLVELIYESNFNKRKTKNII
jgi:endonuclease-3